jgi:hypothetical protein
MPWHNIPKNARSCTLPILLVYIVLFAHIHYTLGRELHRRRVLVPTHLQSFSSWPPSVSLPSIDASGKVSWFNSEGAGDPPSLHEAEIAVVPSELHDGATERVAT